MYMWRAHASIYSNKSVACPGALGAFGALGLEIALGGVRGPRSHTEAIWGPVWGRLGGQLGVKNCVFSYALYFLCTGNLGADLGLTWGPNYRNCEPSWTGASFDFDRQTDHDIGV